MRTLKALVVSILCLGLIVSCDEGTKVNTFTGRLSLELTDAPFPTDLVAEANVTIDRIEIRKSDADEESAFKVINEEEMSFNLLDLTNGVTANLADIEIEVGSYDQVRLYVFESTVVLNDGSVYDLKIPSGSQSGIKIIIQPAIEIVGGLTTNLLLDFDVSQSFVVQGNPDTPAGIKGFLFKPTIRASHLSTAGRLSGTVTNTSDLELEGAQISLMAADTLNTTAFTDTDGEYMILGLEAGLYDITVAHSDYSTASIENIEIVSENTTRQDVVLSEE